MKEATLCYLLRNHPIDGPGEILLGMKKRGFGEGKIVGIGGKLEDGESPAVAAARELEEEIRVRVRPDALERVAYVTFLFPAKPEWNMGVHVFLARRWQGTPVETGEIKPEWFPLDEMPFARMWHDVAFWLLRVLDGERFSAVFSFEDDNETVLESHFEDW